jgi:hypothetical protein
MTLTKIGDNIKIYLRKLGLEGGVVDAIYVAQDKIQ